MILKSGSASRTCAGLAAIPMRCIALYALAESKKLVRHASAALAPPVWKTGILAVRTMAQLENGTYGGICTLNLWFLRPAPLLLGYVGVCIQLFIP